MAERTHTQLAQPAARIADGADPSAPAMQRPVRAPAILRRRPGLKQIAERLNLGISTVSHALKGDGTVSEDTRRRVNEYAVKIGYTVNANARRMRAGKTRVIGLIIPDVVLTYNEFVQHAFRHTASTGRELQIVLTEFDPDLEDKGIRSLLEQRVDGILLKSTFKHWDEVPAGHSLRILVATRVPTVLVGDEIRGSGLPRCRTPTEAQARLLVRDAVAKGHRHVAWFLPIDLREHPLDTLPQHKRAYLAARDEGAQLAGKRFTIRLWTLDQVPATSVATSTPEAAFLNYISESFPHQATHVGRQMVAAAFESGEPVDAIVCSNDIVAIGAMTELRRRGIRVPEEVLVSAYDATTACHLAPLPLTIALAWPEKVARHATGMLNCLIDGQKPKDDDCPTPTLSVVGGLEDQTDTTASVSRSRR
ncbi:MAG: LacI family DNA-binding transcriptional regulator [Phycisphaerae bacterium]